MKYIVFAWNDDDAELGYKFVRVEADTPEKAVELSMVSIYSDMLEKGYEEDECDYFQEHASFAPITEEQLANRTIEQFFQEEIAINRTMQ